MHNPILMGLLGVTTLKKGWTVGVKHNVLFSMQAWHPSCSTTTGQRCQGAVLEIKAYCFSNNEREACHCDEPCWGLNGAVFQSSERARARSQAPGQLHLRPDCSRKVKCSARCYLPISPLQSQSAILSPARTAILLTLAPQAAENNQTAANSGY